MIERRRGQYTGRNKTTAYQDLVWTVATASGPDLATQTAATLATIEHNLLELGSDKHAIVSAQVYLVDINDKPAMDRVWCEWIGDDAEHWPQRVCVGVSLAGDTLVEVSVTAVRKP